jgi:hypothetical protein
MSWALVCLFVLCGLTGCEGSLNITAITWNVNSVAKIRTDVRAVAQISRCDVIFLQETLSCNPDSCLLLPGFVGQHSLAIPTNRCPSRGLSSFFRIETFVDGALSQVGCLTLALAFILDISGFLGFFL